MDKNMEEKIRVVANYIVDNKATIIKTAEHFNMSPSSIKKYINSKDKLQSIDIELFKKVKETPKKYPRMFSKIKKSPL